MALFTFLLIVVGAVQGIFLYRTDQGTHKAADAAQKSVASVVAQLRADVGVNSGGMSVVNLKEGGIGIAIHIELKNSGQTTGYDFNTWIKPPQILSPDATPFGEQTPLNERAGKSIIYRDEIVNVDWVLPISPEDLAAVRDGKKNIFVWGGANYRDAFKEDRFFKFRAINGPDLGNRFALKPHKLGYEAN